MLLTLHTPPMPPCAGPAPHGNGQPAELRPCVLRGVHRGVAGEGPHLPHVQVAGAHSCVRLHACMHVFVCPACPTLRGVIASQACSCAVQDPGCSALALKASMMPPLLIASVLSPACRHPCPPAYRSAPHLGQGLLRTAPRPCFPVSSSGKSNKSSSRGTLCTWGSSFQQQARTF